MLTGWSTVQVNWIKPWILTGMDPDKARVTNLSNKFWVTFLICASFWCHYEFNWRHTKATVRETWPSRRIHEMPGLDKILTCSPTVQRVWNFYVYVNKMIRRTQGERRESQLSLKAIASTWEFAAICITLSRKQLMGIIWYPSIKRGSTMIIKGTRCGVFIKPSSKVHGQQTGTKFSRANF